MSALALYVVGHEHRKMGARYHRLDPPHTIPHYKFMRVAFVVVVGQRVRYPIQCRMAQTTPAFEADRYLALPAEVPVGGTSGVFAPGGSTDVYRAAE
jgi:hypothetical protein